jgi:hypothetical protein
MEVLKNQNYIVLDSKEKTPIEGCFVLNPAKDAAAYAALERYAEATDDIEQVNEISKMLRNIKEVKEASLKAMFEGLPEYSYAKQEVSGIIIKIVRGENGYLPYIPCWQTGITVDQLNQQIGVTKPQAEAMLAGSMFGWNVPGANPSYYDTDGKPIRTK